MTTTTAPTLPALRYDVRQTGLRRWLGPTEAAIMEIVWAAERPITVKGILKRLERSYHPLAYTSVLTTTDRMHDKQLLDRGRAGLAFVYSARETREQFEERQRAAILASLES